MGEFIKNISVNQFLNSLEMVTREPEDKMRAKALRSDWLRQPLVEIAKEYKSTNGFSKDRLRRHIASIPIEFDLYFQKKYGRDYWKNKRDLADLLLSDPATTPFQLVPRDSV